MKTLYAAALSLLVTANAMADYNCEHQEQVKRTMDIEGVNRIKVAAGAGSLDIVGESGRNDIQIDADMCASDKKLLADMSVYAQVEQGIAYIETRIPDGDSWGKKTASIDLTLLVPAALVMEVADSSGSASIRNTGQLTMTDSSGSLEIENIAGDLSVRDSSGSMYIDNIKGEVSVTDSSGSIDIRDVDQGVVIEADSSGSITIKDVAKDVLVKKDSSGSINVKDIGGDFAVLKDSSGGINYKNVAGRVQLPN